MPANEDEAAQLDTLQALFPSRPRADLRRYLSASRGDLDRAFRALERGQEIVSASTDRPTKRARIKGSGGLDAWVRPAHPEVLVLDSSDDDSASTRASSSRAPPDARKSAFDALRAAPATSTTSTALPPPPTHVNLPPLTLATPALVAQHTRGLVTLVENALPLELAARLYVRMVRESTGAGEGDGPWTKNKWYLVDREVESPHTSCFYREVPDKLDPSTGYDPAAFDESAQYWYNGAPRAARPFTAEQDEARQLVGEFVRTLLRGRERHALEWDGDWAPNVAVANCYRGSKESVGFHSDVLQYLGPYPTIASLTLGVTRPFRLRPFLPSQPSAPGLPPKEVRTLDIPLPHNSLLIMHAGCQETYKHAVPPLGGGMDLFRLPRAALDALDDKDRANAQQGFRERINMTFRHYRPDFAPLSPVSAPGYIGTPHCACGVPCTLRPDGRGRARAARGESVAEGEMLFFWVCNAGAQNEGKGCAHWRRLDMRREGRGEWFGGREGGGEGKKEDGRLELGASGRDGSAQESRVPA